MQMASFLFFVLFTLGQACAASAGEPEPAPAGEAQPAALTHGDPAVHVARARELFVEQRYVEAALEMQRAYAFDPKPLYLFNAGQAFRKAEKRTDALEMYQRYLESAPAGTLVAEVNGYIVELQALLKAQENIQDINLRLESERTQLEAEKKKTVEMDLALKKEKKKPWYRHPAFVATVSSVGAIVVIGGVIGITLAALSKTDGGTLVVMPRGF